MPVRPIDLFRRAMNATWRPAGAPLANHSRGLNAVGQARRHAVAERWADAAQGLREAGYIVVAGSPDTVAAIHKALHDLGQLAGGIAILWGYAGSKHPDVSALALVARENVEAVIPLMDALEEVGVDRNPYLELIITNYRELYRV